MKKQSPELESTRKTEQGRPVRKILTFGQRSTQKSKSMDPVHSHPSPATLNTTKKQHYPEKNILAEVCPILLLTLFFPSLFNNKLPSPLLLIQLLYFS